MKLIALNPNFQFLRPEGTPVSQALSKCLATNCSKSGDVPGKTLASRHARNQTSGKKHVLTRIVHPVGRGLSKLLQTWNHPRLAIAGTKVGSVLSKLSIRGRT